MNLQQDWINDLTEQNEMLIKAIEELEQEATERVRLLEQRLNRSGTAEKEVRFETRSELLYPCI